MEKRNVTISFGQGIDTKTDPNQVMPGKMLALVNCTLSESLALKKRYGNVSIAQFTTAVSSSSLTNAKLGVFNNQLVVFDGKACSVQREGSLVPQFIDNYLAAQPVISNIQREANPLINVDAAYNPNHDTTAYIWSSSCIAPNFRQLGFASAMGKFELRSDNGTVLASTGIAGFVKNRVFSNGNYYYWTGIAYASSTLQYYQVPANGSSAIFTPAQTIGTGAVGGDFSATTAVTQFSRYQRYDGVVLNNNLLVAWFAPATSAVNISLVTQSGVTNTQSLLVDATGALGVWGDNNYLWVAYHNGATSAGWAMLSTTSLLAQSGPNPWFTSDAASSSNVVAIPQAITGTSNGTGANAYLQMNNRYPATQFSGAPTIAWNSLQRSDFIQRQSLNGAIGATSGSSAVVVRGMGLASKAFNYLGDDFFLASYGGTQTASSADRLEPTNFLIAATKATNRIVSKIAYQNAVGYDLQTGGHSNYLSNNFGNVGYGLPLPHVHSTPSLPAQFNVPYLTKTEAVTLASSSLVTPFFINYNYGYNVAGFNFNAETLYQSESYGNALNVAGGYLSSFDGKSINEQNFHLFPEDVQLVGTSSFGPAANTYAYQLWYQWQDAQGNIFKSAPSPTKTITTAGSSAIYILAPTLRATNKSGVTIRVARNAPTIDPLTFREINPLTPALNNPNADNIVILDTTTDAVLNAQPPSYTTGGVLENAGVPSPLWITTYKLRVMVLDPETDTWWYSKEVIPGTPVEFSDLQTFSVNSKYGKNLAGIEMDDKFIIFTASPDGSQGAIYFMTGQGPTATGINNDFSTPFLVDATTTLDNPNSLILTPDGIMFQSDKGIWVLNHGMQTEYIGAPVEAYNSAKVTSAQLIPGTTEVRFTLDTGVCLVWDYFQKQWSVFNNIDATHGIIFQGLFTYLNQSLSNAKIRQETPGLYLDDGSPVLMSLATSWLSLAGLQGYQRAYRLYVMGRYESSHLLSVSVAYDFNPSYSQTAIINPIANTNQNYGSDPLWGSLLQYGGNTQFEQNRVNLTRQKCQSIQISIQELLDPTQVAYGKGLVLENIGVVIGGKLTYPKLPPNLSVS